MPKGKAAEEGLGICLETISALREIKGVHGIHIMAIEWEETVGRIIEADYLKKHGGKMCDDGFHYSSDANIQWLTEDEIRNMVANLIEGNDVEAISD